MPQSLASVYVHGVFSTKDRQPFLQDAGLRRRVLGFVGGACNAMGCQVVAVNGVEDHVHMLVRLSRTVSISDWMKEVKRTSSAFAKEFIAGFAWQAGYGAFSVSASDLDRVSAYIRGQEERHRKVSFQEEFLRLLEEHGLEWDERYLWDWHNASGLGGPRYGANAGRGRALCAVPTVRED